MVVENETIMIAFGVVMLLLTWILFHLIVLHGKINEIVTISRRLDAVQCDLGYNLDEYNSKSKYLNEQVGKLVEVLLSVSERIGATDNIQKKLIKMINKNMYKKG